MKKSLLMSVVLMFIAPAAFAANMYKMKMELTVDGKIVARPTVVTAENQKATISEKANDATKSFYIEVIPTETDKMKKGIQLDIVVGSDENGKKTVLGTPQIITKEKKDATISVAKSDGSESMSLKVWTERVKK